jgi:hypothetical protein
LGDGSNAVVGLAAGLLKQKAVDALKDAAKAEDEIDASVDAVRRTGRRSCFE